MWFWTKWVCISLFPDITFMLDDIPEPPEAARSTTDQFLYEWEQGSAHFPETDVWMIKTRRLNIVMFTWKPNSDVCLIYSRRLF